MQRLEGCLSLRFFLWISQPNSGHTLANKIECLRRPCHCSFEGTHWCSRNLLGDIDSGLAPARLHFLVRLARIKRRRFFPAAAEDLKRLTRIKRRRLGHQSIAL